jgi:nucleotide-binding universal stress UspA family protein
MGGELLLLHVVPDIFLRWCDELAVGFIDGPRLEAAYEELREEGQRKFSTWLPSRASNRCRTLVVVGDTTEAIIKVAQQEAVDVIIMRAPKRRWWRPLLAISVTDTIMRQAPVPVVVWAGLDRRSAQAWWQDGQHPHESDAQAEGTWRDRERTRWERTTILKSW